MLTRTTISYDDISAQAQSIESLFSGENLTSIEQENVEVGEKVRALLGIIEDKEGSITISCEEITQLFSIITRPQQIAVISLIREADINSKEISEDLQREIDSLIEAGFVPPSRFEPFLEMCSEEENLSFKAIIPILDIAVAISEKSLEIILQLCERDPISTIDDVIPYIKEAPKKNYNTLLAIIRIVPEGYFESDENKKALLHVNQETFIAAREKLIPLFSETQQKHIFGGYPGQQYARYSDFLSGNSF